MTNSENMALKFFIACTLEFPRVHLAAFGFMGAVVA